MRTQEFLNRNYTISGYGNFTKFLFLITRDGVDEFLRDFLRSGILSVGVRTVLGCKVLRPYSGLAQCTPRSGMPH